MQYEKFYKEGYDCGYAWLTRGANFLHPSESVTRPSGIIQRGYIPGGPSTSVLGDDGHAKVKAWRNGWVDGLNAYVTKHKLAFPLLNQGG
jgi:hypothetical protein